MTDDHAEPSNQWARQAYDTWRPALVRYGYSLTQDLELARDAAQETFLRLCQQPREQVEPHLRAWLFRVCRSRIIDHYRKAKHMSPLDDSSLAATPDQAPSPDHQAERQDTTRQLLAQVALLPHPQREVLRLKFQNGMSYQEIADVTQLTVSHVGVLLHKALNTLRQQNAN